MASRTESFRQHHAEVRDLAGRIDAQLDLVRITADAGPTATLLRALFGKFGVHLAIEDSTLYPRMIDHADPRLRQTAARFQREMGGLKEQFDGFRSRWPGPTAISHDPKAFIDEARAILTVLRRRISREDAELYDLYDGAA